MSALLLYLSITLKKKQRIKIRHSPQDQHFAIIRYHLSSSMPRKKENTILFSVGPNKELCNGTSHGGACTYFSIRSALCVCIGYVYHLWSRTIVSLLAAAAYWQTRSSSIPQKVRKSALARLLVLLPRAECHYLYTQSRNIYIQRLRN